MRHPKRIIILLALLFAAGAVISRGTDQPARGVPNMTTVDPSSGKAGDVVTASGEYLDKSHVAGLYLTMGKTDVKVEIVEQAANFLRFKIPAEANPGRYHLLILMGGPDPKLLEEPVTLVVE